MARPIKNTVDYFPHIIQNGKTIFILENKFGNDGYAFWFKLLELLGSSDNQVYDYNNLADWEFLIAKTKVSEEKAHDILKTLADVGAIDGELLAKKVIWCENFVKGIEDVYRKRRQNRPQKPVIDDGNPTTPVVSATETPQSKVKETKVNNNKEKKGDIFLKAWKDFKEMRKKIKKPMTDKAEEMLLNNLDKLTKDKVEQVAILNQSVFHCWQGVFPLKDRPADSEAQPKHIMKLEPKFTPEQIKVHLAKIEGIKDKLKGKFNMPETAGGGN